MPPARAFPFTPDSRSCTPNRWPTLERLLSLYLDADLTIADIAFTLFLPIARILELVKRPESVEALKDYEIEHKKRAKHLATCNIDTAACAFVRLHAATKPQPTPRDAQSPGRQGGGTSTSAHNNPPLPRALPHSRSREAAPEVKPGAEAPGKPHPRLEHRRCATQPA